MTTASRTPAGFAVPGLTDDTAVRFAPDVNGTLRMIVVNGDGPHMSVVLGRSWLPVLAAWFAGESRPDVHAEPDSQCLLCVVGDEAAVVWSTRTWARLRCEAPFGPAEVQVCPLYRTSGPSVRLSPAARQKAARELRRVSAA